jgi:hypothetical protein
MDQSYVGTLSASGAAVCSGRIEWIPAKGKPGHNSGISLQLDRGLTSSEVEQINNGELRLAYNRQTVTHIIFDPEFMELAQDANEGDSQVQVKFKASYDPEAPLPGSEPKGSKGSKFQGLRYKTAPFIS